MRGLDSIELTRPLTGRRDLEKNSLGAGMTVEREAPPSRPRRLKQWAKSHHESPWESRCPWHAIKGLDDSRFLPHDILCSGVGEGKGCMELTSEVAEDILASTAQHPNQVLV